MRDEAIAAVAGGSISSLAMSEASVMEQLEISSYADFQATPEDVLVARLAIRAVLSQKPAGRAGKVA